MRNGNHSKRGNHFRRGRANYEPTPVWKPAPKRPHFAFYSGDSAEFSGSNLQSPYDSANLRHHPVKFVSAGYSFPLEDSQIKQVATTQKTSDPVLQPTSIKDPEPIQKQVSLKPSTPTLPKETRDISPDQQPRDQSPARSESGSSSCSEVLIFRGRGQRIRSPPSPRPTKSPASIPGQAQSLAVPEETDTPVTVVSDFDKSSTEQKDNDTRALDLEELKNEINVIGQYLDDTPIPEGSSAIESDSMVKGSHRRLARRESRQRKKQRARNGHDSRNNPFSSAPIQLIDGSEDDDEDELEAMCRDYAENMVAHGEDTISHTWARRDLGGEEGDVAIFPEPTTISVEASDSDEATLEILTPQDSNSHGSEKTTEDSPPFDISIYPEAPGELQVDIRNGFKAAGWEVESAEAEVEAEERVEEASHSHDPLGIPVDSDDDSTEGENDDEEDDEEDEEDGEDYDIEFDDDDDDDDIDIDDYIDFPEEYDYEEAFLNGEIILFSSDAMKQQNRRQQKGNTPYFNVNLDPQILDKATMSRVTDRARKTNKKLEREKLRAQGLLGKKAQKRASNPSNLEMIYPSGMTYEQITTEVWSFLLDDYRHELNFPPMAPHFRKGLHELAHKLNMQSKSRGKGANRQLSFSKRGTTIAVEPKYRQVIAQVGRHHFKIKTSTRPGKESVKTSGRSATVHDGQVVGGNCPQLGTENKGHALLKKMGWNHGTGLGTVDNKGILEPVQGVVKKDKSGLK